MEGTSAIGSINDTDPQPLIVRSKLGLYAICFVGVINNREKLVEEYVKNVGQLGAMSSGIVNSTELLAALINEKSSFLRMTEILLRQETRTAGFQFISEKMKAVFVPPLNPLLITSLNMRIIIP